QHLGDDSGSAGDVEHLAGRGGTERINQSPGQRPIGRRRRGGKGLSLTGEFFLRKLDMVHRSPLWERPYPTRAPGEKPSLGPPAKQSQRRALVHCDVVGLVALDLVLRIVRAR